MDLSCGMFVIDMLNVCQTWRVGIRRVWGLPSNAHSAFLPLLCCRLPLYDELMKRLLTFTQKCINSYCDNKLVNFVARYAVWYSRMASPLGCRVFQCCSKYDFEYEDIIMSLSHQYIQGYYRSVISDEDVVRVQILLELLFIRSGVYHLDNFSVSDVSNHTLSFFSIVYFIPVLYFIMYCCRLAYSINVCT